MLYCQTTHGFIATIYSHNDIGSYPYPHKMVTSFEPSQRLFFQIVNKRSIGLHSLWKLGQELTSIFSFINPFNQSVSIQLRANELYFITLIDL